MDALALQRVLSHQHRLQRADELRAIHRRGVGRRAEESMPLQPLIRVDAEQPEAAGGRGKRAEVIARCRDAVPCEDGQRYVVYFHGVSSVVGEGRLQTTMCPV